MNAPERPVTILFATRLEAPTDQAVGAARDLALRTEGRLVLLYVAEELATATGLASGAGIEADQVRDQLRREVRERVDAFVVRHLTELPVRSRVAEGPVVTSVVEAAREEGADYLLVGTEVHSPLHDLVLGSTTRGILRRAPCPVVVVRTG
jgi:nucleotide-binding universal stress UspA family protein